MPRRYPVAVAVIACASVMLTGRAAAQLEPGEPADGFEQSTWLENVSQPTDIAFLSDGRGVIVCKNGRIVVMRADGTMLRSEAARLEVDTDSEKGLLGVVRDDADNLYLYMSDGDADGDKHHVYKATVDEAGVVSVDTSRSIIGDGLEGPANHDGGGMVIHRGQLYVGVGDTGYNASPPTNRYGTCLNKANGKVLRVELDGSIPSDNPLVGMAMVTGCASPNDAFGMFPPDERIYAWGLRNPWRIYLDPATDLVWIGDVGEVMQEEITVGGKGVHHGWPFREGTVMHGELGGLGGCEDVVPSTACVAPQHGYPRDDGTSVTGGLIPPAGCGWGELEDRYFFGDFGSGQVWTIDLTPDRSGTVPGSRRAFTQVAGNVSFRIGPDGAMYVASYYESSIIRIAPKSVPASCAQRAVPPVTPGAAGTAGNGSPSSPASGPVDGSSGGCGCELSAPRPRAAPSWAWMLLTLVFAARRARGAARTE
jgi:glucose/arabinose dehydrogenase